MIQQFVHVYQSRLHLLLHPLTFIAITVDEMDGLQHLLTCLQFKIHFQNDIHSFLHLLPHFLFLMLHPLMLNASPLVFQPLQIDSDLFDNSLIASGSRHLDSALDQY